jgi:hypothetical protein
MLRVYIDLYSVTNTAYIIFVRQVNADQNCQPDDPWNYHHHGQFYERAASGFLVLSNGHRFIKCSCLLLCEP